MCWSAPSHDVTPEVADAIRALVVAFMDKWVADAAPKGELDQIREEGISPSGLLAPFHDALVPGITLLRERSFSTRLGNLHERVAEMIASSAHREAKRAYDLEGSMPKLAQEVIAQRLNALEAGEIKPDAAAERAELLGTYGQAVSDSTRIDLRLVTHGGDEHLFEMKSGKPNKGQCREMKERLMKAIAIRRSESTWAWWGVPYDPYGERAYAHPYPRHFFDFAAEVKLGSMFWNFVGGDDETYNALLAIYNGVGLEFSERLRSLLSRGL